MKKIVGYSDKISAALDDTIRFMVSCDGPTSYRADLVRIIHGDLNPEGPGFKEKIVAGVGGDEHRGRKQEVYAGSHVLVPDSPVLGALSSFTLQAMVWPTTPEKGRQSLIGKWSESSQRSFALIIDELGAAALLLGDGSSKTESISSGKALLAREWYVVAASYDATSREVCLYQEPLVEYATSDSTATVQKESLLQAVAKNDAPLIMAAHYEATIEGRVVCGGHFNGKLDSPRPANRVLSRIEIEALKQGPVPSALQSAMAAAWDFSCDISSEMVTDISGSGSHGETINLPARGMKGHNWTGEEMSWRHAPGARDGALPAPAGFAEDPAARREIELVAMEAVMTTESGLGNTPEDVPARKVGYDIASYDPDTRCHRFIEVKGRVEAQTL